MFEPAPFPELPHHVLELDGARGVALVDPPFDLRDEADAGVPQRPDRGLEAGARRSSLRAIGAAPMAESEGASEAIRDGEER